MKQQLKQRSSNKINNNIDSRLQSLTQTLMTKQNALEVVTTERNALRIQLEKLDVSIRIVKYNNTRGLFFRMTIINYYKTRELKYYH